MRSGGDNVGAPSKEGKRRIGKIDNITKTIHIHPALSEVIRRAASEL